MSDDNVVALAAAKSLAPDIVAGLRGLADMLEAGAIAIPVTTCIVVMGHSESTPEGPKAYQSKWVLGPRADPFTVSGLLTVALAS